MAKIQGSYLGVFSGRLGSAIGYMWNGRFCVRSRPAAVKNPRTEAQVLHREMFKYEVQQAKLMRQAVNLGLRPAARAMGMTPYNAFVSLNQHAFSLVDGAFAVDWASLVLSEGPVPKVGFESAVVEESNVLTVSFAKNPEHKVADSFDSVYLYVYCPALRQGYLTTPVYRRMKTLSVMLPQVFADNDLQLFMIVGNERGQFSETIYCGSLTLAAGCMVDTTAAAQDIADTQTVAAPDTAPSTHSASPTPEAGIAAHETPPLRE